MNNITYDKLKEHYNLAENDGRELIGIFLQGSQNYGISDANSDVDTKAIVIPNFSEFALNQERRNIVLELDSGEHCDVKDVRRYFEIFKKQNINILEILFTKYSIINPIYKDAFQPLINNRELIARYDMKAAVWKMFGDIVDKSKAMTHPYPTTKYKFDKWGYDPKYLEHMIRFQDVMTRYIQDYSFKDCLIPIYSKEYLLEVKNGKYTLEEAIELSNDIVKESREIKDKYMKKLDITGYKSNKEVDVIMNNVIVELLKIAYYKEFSKGE